MLHTTLLGPVLADPRMPLPIDAVGFHDDSTFSSTDEQRCLPAQCGPAPGGCQDVVGDDQGPAVASNGLAVRELVHDFDFRKSTGMVRNCRDLVAQDSDLKKALPDDNWSRLRDFIIATAADQFPSGGVWNRSGAVTLPKTGLSLAKGMERFVARRGVDYSSLDTQVEVEGERDRWAAELAGLTTSHSPDVVAGLTSAADRSADGTVPYALFPATSSRLVQTLDFANRGHNLFLVRIEYELTTSSGSSVGVSLVGPGVHRSASWTASSGMGRRIAELTVTRSATTEVGDIVLTVRGRSVRVFSVSVRPNLPVHSEVTGADYELVVLDDGVTWETARDLASRASYRGRPGILARAVSVAQLSELSGLFRPDTTAWVDGVSRDGSAGSFQDRVGIVSSALFMAGTSFTEPWPRGAFAFTWSSDRGMRLGHAPPSVSVEGRIHGFLVEYQLVHP